MTTVDVPPREFAVTVGFEGSLAILSVSGEVNSHRALELGALLEAVIGRGHRSVVVDLATVDSISESGLGVIADCADHLEHLGGKLTIRSPTGTVRRILEITGLSDLVHLEPAPLAARLGAEEPIDVPETPRVAPLPRLARQMRAVTAIPADDDVVDGALRLVVALARVTVGGADGVSVSLRRHGRLATVATSDQTISDMDANQYATGEGPCVDASVEGRWFHAGALETETRWPAFTPRARALGINAILSSPLLADERPVGALNIYSRSVAAFAPKDQQLAAVFATEASTILTLVGADITEDQLANRLGEALRTRQIIAEALGVIMEREGVDDKSAYTLLRRFSQTSNRPLRDRAEEVVASTRPIPNGPKPGPDGGHHG